MAMVMATNTDAVPRSGWAITMITGRAIRPRARTKPGKGSSSPRSVATNAASTRIRVTLASSDGWSWKGPMTNQARVPLRDRARIVTAMSRIVVTPKKNRAQSRNLR
jgi:hypothetical protein